MEKKMILFGMVAPELPGARLSRWLIVRPDEPVIEIVDGMLEARKRITELAADREVVDLSHEQAVQFLKGYVGIP